MKDQRKNAASQNALDVLNWCECGAAALPAASRTVSKCSPGACVIATGEQTASTFPRKARLTASGIASGGGRLPGGSGICSGPGRSDWILTNRKARDRWGDTEEAKIRRDCLT